MRSSPPFSSRTRIFTISLLASFFVLVVSLVIQWLVYDDWLLETGPLRIVGTSIAALVTLVFMLRWQYRVREQQREMVRRFELISHMNDRIRNALQAIECVAYVSRLDETGIVKQEVEAIDKVLREVLTETGFASVAEARGA
jgi:type VI protein secretion system component VasK